jgi:hypothetical protein
VKSCDSPHRGALRRVCNNYGVVIPSKGAEPRDLDFSVDRVLGTQFQDHLSIFRLIVTSLRESNELSRLVSLFFPWESAKIS